MRRVMRRTTQREASTQQSNKASDGGDKQHCARGRWTARVKEAATDNRTRREERTTSRRQGSNQDQRDKRRGREDTM